MALADLRPCADLAQPGRRALLGALGLAGAGLLLPGCAARAVRAGGDSGRSAPGLRLPMPDVRPELVIRDVAGLRPFRPQGFRVEAERIGDTLMIHNYGHGGCGVTLSWGTAKLALDIALDQPHRRVAVLGCGAVGLATARLFQDHGFEVSIHARELPPDTTSNIAGALWAPSYLLDREHETDAFGARLAAASRYAHRYFQLLPDVRYGIAWTRMFMFARGAEAQLSWDWGVTPELFASAAHAPGSHPFGARWLHEHRLMMIEPSIYLPAVIDAFRLAGGTIHVREIPDLDALRALDAPVVVNCTGLGARALVGDTTMTPIRGQLRVLAPQPAIDYGVIGSGLYMFPRRDGIILGGTRDRDDWSTQPDPETAARLLAGHRELFGA